MCDLIFDLQMAKHFQGSKHSKRLTQERLNIFRLLIDVKQWASSQCIREGIVQLAQVEEHLQGSSLQLDYKIGP